MVTKTCNYNGVKSFLYEEELTNSPIIRLLDTPNLEVEIWLDASYLSNGILFIQSPCPGTWDSAQYPIGWKRVWIESLSASRLDFLLNYLPQDVEFLFKFHRPWIAAHITQRLPMEWLQTVFYFWMTSSDFINRQKHSVVELTAHHLCQSADLMAKSGRTVDNLRQSFAHPEAAVFGVFQDGQLVSGAFVDPRTKRTMEICAVYTHESYRGQGLATSVVSTATDWVLQRGKLPVYATRMTNTVSMHLAQSLGYTKYGQIGHYHGSHVSNAGYQKQT